MENIPSQVNQFYQPPDQVLQMGSQLLVQNFASKHNTMEPIGNENNFHHETFHQRITELEQRINFLKMGQLSP